MRRVGVVGATGSMGTLACEALRDAGDLEVSVLVSRHAPGDALGASWAASLDAVAPGDVDVLVDLSTTETARKTISWAASSGTDAVVGTSGLTDADLAGVAAAAAGSGARLLIVPNFSIGAVLAQRFAAQAAAHFASVEIVELHHDRKRDAPSGTSIATARSIAAARDAAGMDRPHDPTETETIEGARGAVGPGGIRLHSVRLAGLLAHQEVHFGGPGEGLTIRHDTFERSSFMAGLVLAVRRIDRVEGVAVGLEAVLD